LKKIVALASFFAPSTCITLPKPKRSCSTSMPTCRLLVSDGANPGVGLCALGNSVRVLGATFGLGLVNISRCPHADRSSTKDAPLSGTGRGLKSSSKYAGFNSSRKRLGSQLLSVPQRYREVA